MSDLPTPITREERYLNGIAQGDTSNLPTPVGREEKYLDYIARNGGGGGGGTTNYNVLENKPQIAGTTLQGNKSLADLGIASAEALTNKVDKVAGKGLSTNDYDNAEKDKVADNAAAIEAINENGCCNILDNNQPSEVATNITWTVNADKTVTASSSGQSVSGLEHHEINHSYTLQPGTYKLSGGVDSNNYIELLETNYDYTGIIDTGNGYEFTVSSAHTYIVLLRSGNGVVNCLFKPMLYDARLNPSGYVPYAMTNRELTERVTQSEFVSIGTDGVKTQKQLMQDLYALVDLSKISMQSKLVLNNANSLSFFSLTEKALDNRFLCFMRTAVSSAVGEVIETYQLGNNTAYAGKAYGGVEHETSSEVLSAGMSFAVYY